MILYHGSDHIIEKPVFGEGKSYSDYGRGKYRTIATKPVAEDATYVIDIIRNNWKNGQGI